MRRSTEQQSMSARKMSEKMTGRLSLESARYCTLPCLTSPHLTLPYPTLPCRALPYLVLSSLPLLDCNSHPLLTLSKTSQSLIKHTHSHTHTHTHRLMSERAKHEDTYCELLEQVRTSHVPLNPYINYVCTLPIPPMLPFLHIHI